ncbi:ABC transporter ATP-binding protein [Pukyongiella litopenaei]|uniref:ABC transporter ATP-binding protein n=1 Tax=Pukyongiella litopenaei TaxID=2605946 RepID=A0A2S0MRE2_9RHOB|nr:ABC transporter ATP-binding protein [Pukyongiella litopenaei]AVO38263.1 ABC transporter ATP-binding protein [Pukyongiella litopenaei]
MTTPPLLEVRDLTISLRTPDGQGIKVTERVSFGVGEGETVCVVGESGSGKTITLMGVLGLLNGAVFRLQGSVRFRGDEILNRPQSALRRIRGREIALIPQDPTTALTPVRTVGSQIVEQMRSHGNISRDAARRRAIELLDEVGIVDPSGAFDCFPHQLSGGMRQRVVIAAALSCNPSLIIADEPTTALDVTVQAQILDLLGRLSRNLGLAIVLVTHDMGIVAEMADRVLIMYGGRVVERGARDEIFSDPWHPYTAGLLASIPPLDGARAERLPSIPGTPPQPGNWPSGCVFAPRCALRTSACMQPPPRHSAGGREAYCVIEPRDRRPVRAGTSRDIAVDFQT